MMLKYIQMRLIKMVTVGKVKHLIVFSINVLNYSVVLSRKVRGPFGPFGCLELQKLLFPFIFHGNASFFAKLRSLQFT